MKAATGLSGQDRRDWLREHEADLTHYGQYGDIGAHAASMIPHEGGGGGGIDPKPPRYLFGADLWVILTVEERLQAADKLMPVAEEGKHMRPSAGQILRTRYGDRGFKWDDSAPVGSEQWLALAQIAYCEAARKLPRYRRKTVDDIVEAKRRAIRGGT